MEAQAGQTQPSVATTTFADLTSEPYRLLFPAGVLAGIAGVALWPLYFLGVTQFYPGQIHPRIMTCGMFGAFIVGFLGTAMPKMLSARLFRRFETSSLFLLQLAMVAAFGFGKLAWGDLLFLTFLSFLILILSFRWKSRKDIPPPGFCLVGLALCCAITGSILGIAQNYRELDPFWIGLQRLLLYQGFVLLPILGIAPFLLPRFFGQPNAHEFPETLVPNNLWKRKTAGSLMVGLVILATFVAEAKGWQNPAYLIRFFTVLIYLLFELPWRQASKKATTVSRALRLSLISLPAGFLTVPFFPAYRVSFMHLTLVGGFAVLMFVVATRVVYGHSGNLEKLSNKNHWLYISVGAMLFGMVTRMSGDFLPKAMASHYIYGALLWIAGALVWSGYVLPLVFVRDKE